MSDLYSSHLRNWVLSSPPADWLIRQVRELLIGALRQGPIPRHVSFEMDGNRRYARSHGILTSDGHYRGFEALARVVEICYKCGVTHITVYAFSIENFNRPEHEVKYLMKLAKEKLTQMAEHGELLDRYGARVQVLGRRDLIPPDVLEAVDRAMDMTKDNKECVLNICFPYTSRDEMTTAIKSTVEEYSTSPAPHSTQFSETRIRHKILSKQLNKAEPLSTIREASPAPSSSKSDDIEDSASSSATLHHASPQPKNGDASNIAIYPDAEAITASTVENHMYTAGCPPLDIFIRTSGVERLSDFLLWQCHQDTHIFFSKHFWPDFDLWHFIPILLEWQWRQKQKERDETPRGRVKQL